MHEDSGMSEDFLQSLSAVADNLRSAVAKLVTKQQASKTKYANASMYVRWTSTY